MSNRFHQVFGKFLLGAFLGLTTSIAGCVETPPVDVKQTIELELDQLESELDAANQVAANVIELDDIVIKARTQ